MPDDVAADSDRVLLTFSDRQLKKQRAFLRQRRSY